jgi:2-amino-4-hydroxy-6-hydroxymethyldihydropteridine diphosphokinase
MHTSPVICYIALGANLGDAHERVLAAMQSIATLPRTQLLRRSSLYKTAPLESLGPDYINAAVAVLTHLTAPALLEQLQNLEQQALRERPYPNAPRTLDLDLLIYGSAHISSPLLTVPHPRMMQRAFVLQPLAEIAPKLVSVQALQAVENQICERLADEQPFLGTTPADIYLTSY